VKALQRMLGHASASMTLDRYAHLFDDDLVKVSDALEGQAQGTEKPRLTGVCCGRYRTRTDDLFRVKEARYQLRQSPWAVPKIPGCETRY
jgi:hypothetical protein